MKSIIADEFPRIGKHIRLRSVSKLRDLTVENLKDLSLSEIIINNDEMLAVLIPFELYNKIQEEIESLERNY